VEHLGYLCAAYSAIFIVIFLYVVFLWRRQARLEAELKAVEGKLAENPTGSTPSRPAP